MTDFFHMGGYAAFVWPSYAVVVGGLVALAVASFRKQRRLAREAERLKRQGKGGRR